MSAEYLPNPGSYNEFSRNLISEAGYDPGEPILIKEYTAALTGLQKAIAEQRGVTLLQVHNPEFVDIAA